VEVTTLIIPDENDSDEEPGESSRFIAQLDGNMPWHISRFQPAYEFADYPATQTSSLIKAREIGKQEGLRYIYLVNVPDEDSDTYCYNCGKLLLKRRYPGLEEPKLKNGHCPSCGTQIYGLWQ
jgi:pyruvate formate lyase activating enzyme